ncbi:NAD(P)/FAD-dependent oxidoreductase [Pseudomonas gingeri]|uniref:FAD-binding oxidoreductase n=1 Tax=Pseudomonas gingeri TaxID=117681 RepID=A0A7Y7YFR9_9PSED|nr:FAD-dependent oxidoreductase [Pseudomonas gingeri]NWA02590.1 FAD-binding oxidoreductase [Pseudomonas gingeri]NWA12237.1 FAD-binding oxidoreductase [Pseudomonas gingeri]NWA57357.1 FAD-binding oxidoreductase [Pseudomonas gingeri]NWA93700.1 FAD-binding oxidoreductase [Pseudomonas gingeri]NWB03172.1 FAD-binding oxidoreductase [Pseudomonas gingeri]
MADVIVIGGGLVGCATAYYLAKDGVDVLVLERTELNTQASGSNAGSLHAQIPHDPFVNKGPEWARRFAPSIGLMARSIAMWHELPKELGVDLEVSTKGGLLVATSEQQLREIEAKAALEREHGLEVNLLDQAAVRELAPYLSDRVLGGAFCPIEGKASPLIATLAYADAAKRLGAKFRRHSEVIGIEQGQQNFRVRLAGEDLVARRVVNAAGADAGRIAAMLGIHTDVQGFAIQVAVTEQTGPLIAHLVYSAGEKLTLKQNAIGSVLIGGGWPARWHGRGHPVTDPDSLAQNMALALQTVPALGPLRVIRTWAAVVNGTDDWRPILGEAPGVPGFFMGFFPWMGFTAGPIVARIIASLVQDKPVPLDIDYRPFLYQ